MVLAAILYIAGFLFQARLVWATQLELKGRRRPISGVDFGGRSIVSGNSPIHDSADISYTTDVTLGGRQYTLIVDTGSSDLWVAGNVPGAIDTGISSSVNYAVGSVEGPIKLSVLEFAGYVVPKQSYLEVMPSDRNLEGTGVIGLGPNTGSSIFRESHNSQGDSVLNRIFVQNDTTPNFISVLLGRTGSSTNQYPGNLTVGEVIAGYEEILQQPQLPVTQVPVLDDANQHFQVFLDEDGIIGPDGHTIPVTTEVEGTTNKKQATVIFDTGYSLPQVPKSISDAIYGSFPGSRFVNVTGAGPIWILPCDQEVNITFKFGGRKIPIHPLDSTFDPATISLTDLPILNGKPSCLGTFQPVSFNGNMNLGFDMVLGMAFLRNSYMLVNFGNFIEGSTNKAKPYVQLLSTTNDTAEAHREFVRSRLNGIDTTQPMVSVSSTSNQSHKLLYILVGTIAGSTALAFLGLISFYYWRWTPGAPVDRCSPSPQRTSPSTTPTYPTLPY